MALPDIFHNLNEADWGVVDSNGIGDCWYETTALEEVFACLQQIHSPGFVPPPAPEAMPKLINNRLTVAEVFHWKAKVHRKDKVVDARTRGLREELKNFLLEPGAMARVPILTDNIFPTLQDLVMMSVDDISVNDKAWALSRTPKRKFPEAYAYLIGRDSFWATLVEIVVYTLKYPDTRICCLRVESGLEALSENIVGNGPKIFAQLVQVGAVKGSRKRSPPAPSDLSHAAASHSAAYHAVSSPSAIKPMIAGIKEPSTVALETTISELSLIFQRSQSRKASISQLLALSGPPPSISKSPSPAKSRSKRKIKDLFMSRQMHYSPLFRIVALNSVPGIDFSPLPKYREDNNC
jgi:hypothetical protein